ncbi:MAG: hypothetical protein WA146_08870 [Thiobacillus sp.]|nr:hypothetical protein [Thiobacillus sp.]MDO9387325.1 hypothetical protein [Thiobacillus sp.]
MKVSNIVLSTAVAISTAGALGLAYAQSYSEPQPGTSAPTTQNATPMRQDATPAPGMRDPGGDASQDSRSTMSQDSPDSTGTTRSGSTYNERVARADRN